MSKTTANTARSSKSQARKAIGTKQKPATKAASLKRTRKGTSHKTASSMRQMGAKTVALVGKKKHVAATKRASVVLIKKPPLKIKGSTMKMVTKLKTAAAMKKLATTTSRSLALPRRTTKSSAKTTSTSSSSTAASKAKTKTAARTAPIAIPPNQSTTTTTAEDCGWAGFYSNATSALYQEYHDKEWGRPRRNGIEDDPMLFEMLVLELSQAGLSWATILNKREAYRKSKLVDLDFVLEKVQSSRKKVGGASTSAKASANKAQEHAKLFDRAVEYFLALPGEKNDSIVRNRKKIEAAIFNAGKFREIQQQYGSFCDFMWALVEEHETSSRPSNKTTSAAPLVKINKRAELLENVRQRQQPKPSDLPAPRAAAGACKNPIILKKMPVINTSYKTMKDIPAKTSLSDFVAKELTKTWEMKFLGTTTVYAYLQACGFVNDHLPTCSKWKECC
ncbi:unnamed protein product [Amoebophrya sp. A120]|nr:unnamed protein product [Amoebophrya sp. A120]|eukprot:GSA120T00010583001.1